MVSSGVDSWTQQDEELYRQLRQKHDRIYARKRRDKHRVYPYVPRRKKGAGSAGVVGSGVAGRGRGDCEGLGGSAADTVKATGVAVKRCLVCRQPSETLDLRGRCQKCR